MATKACERCGSTFSGKPSQIAIRRFCSKRCANPSQHITVLCERCSQPFTCKPSHIERRHHCSHACKSNRVTYQCEQCGTSRTVAASATAKRFCSNACRLTWFSTHFRAEQSPHWKGGAIDYYGPNWKNQRNKARHRDGQRCRHCGTHRSALTEELSVAHVRPFRDFGLDRYREANALANLISLCRVCHIKHDWEEGHRS